jgi:hypothetical protein
MTTGRNDPCHCGSGRKYKRCHYAADKAASAGVTNDEVSPFHDLDNRLVDELAIWATKRFGARFVDVLRRLEADPEMTAQFGAPFLAYASSVDGRRVLDWYLEERGWALTRGEREWLEWQQRSWLSIWEVLQVHPGRGLELRDVLTGEMRSVHEVSGSKSVQPHHMLLARVVDTDSVSVICGLYARPLRPLQASPVVDRMRRLLRRKGTVTPDRLRESRILWEMLEAWADEVSAHQAPPRLLNTDGEAVLLTEDRWTFHPAKREEILQRIATIENIEPEEDGAFAILEEGNRMHADWDNTVIAHVQVNESTLLASTNSVPRADVIRARIESVCGSLVNAGARSHTDPASASHEPKERRIPTPEEQAIVRELKERHYEQWLNDALPALSGMTPHEAANTKEGRERLMMILSEIELAEWHAPEGARFDVGKLRRALGLKS